MFLKTKVLDGSDKVNPRLKLINVRETAPTFVILTNEKYCQKARRIRKDSRVRFCSALQKIYGKYFPRYKRQR